MRVAESSAQLDTDLLVSLRYIDTDKNRSFSMPHILIVEDQPTLLDSLSRGLQEEGYEVSAAMCVADAQRLMAQQPFDAMILDVMLPDRDGLSFLRELRAQAAKIPILVVTARDSIEDRVTGLDSGADDYLIKPFSFAELVARLRALLRRVGTATESTLRVADLELDLLTRRVTRAGEPIDLTQRQFALLACLMRHAGQTVSRDVIAREVWQETTATWTNVIEVQINHLRRKIERRGWPYLLHTIRGEGYVIGDVK